MRVLISGASIAGPVLAYWLQRYGIQSTLVERASEFRKAGGHAVDLFRPSMDIVERMGLLDQVRARDTGIARMTFVRPGARPIDVDLGRVLGVDTANHVEVMRDDLSEIFYQSTRDESEYIFGDSISAIDDRPSGVRVEFDKGRPRSFDLVIGADGLRSNTRDLIFGRAGQAHRFLGGYLAVASVPNYLDLSTEMFNVTVPGRMVNVYSPRHMDEGRALFLFRSPHRLDYHHRDVAKQRQLVRDHFGRIGSEVPRLLDEMDRSTTFYFDEISQLRLDNWSRGRVGLVGDAAYCPGPAVGGSTSMGVIGAYVLAGELAAADGHPRAFAAYQREMTDYVRRARAYAARMSRQVVPDTSVKAWGGAQILRLISSLPARPARFMSKIANTTGVHQDVTVKQYPHSIGDPAASSGEKPTALRRTRR